MKVLVFSGSLIVSNLLMPVNAIAATIQMGVDSNNLHDCGSLTSMNLTSTGIQITGPDVESSNCLGSTSTGASVATDKTSSVTGGSATTIDLSAGATVTLPFESPAATIVSQPTKGTVSLSGTTATYSASVAQTATTDSFTFLLNDASANNTNTATVSLNISAGGTSGGGGSCVTSGNIVCKGIVNPLIEYGSPVTGTGDTQDKNHWILPVNTIHVYEFTYSFQSVSAASTVGSIQFVADQGSPGKTMKISTTAGDVSSTTSDSGCYMGSNYFIRGWSDTNTPSAAYCELHDGTTYYLNIKTNSTSDDQYLLFTQN